MVPLTIAPLCWRLKETSNAFEGPLTTEEGGTEPCFPCMPFQIVDYNGE